MTTAMHTQQDVLYASEIGLDRGYRFTGMPELQEWLDDLRNSWWWERWLGDTIHRVEADWGRPGRGVAGVGWFDTEAEAGRMEFARGTVLTEKLVIHELSHVVASARRRSQSHDPWFARIYLELMYLIRGSWAYEQLKQTFDAHGIDYEAGGIT